MLLQSIIYITHLLSWTTLIAQAYPQADTDVVVLNRRATTCNGHAELCDRSFGNVTFIGAHNSYAIGTTPASNQDQSILQQLNDGIRMLQMQAHNENGTIKLCHTTCVLYDGGTLRDYLQNVKTWLDANPNEVLSLLIVNIDNMPATRYATVFSAVGLDAMSYSPTTLPLPASGWPTMGSLIDSGKRLITFIDNTADPTAVPYIIDEFSNIWETAYGVTSPAFDCLVSRTRGDTSTQMFLINHFLDTRFLGVVIPDMDKLNATNAATGSGSVGAQVSTCIETHGRPPNFILVDYYEYGGGSVFSAAATINGVTYKPTSPIAVPSPTGARSSTTSTVASLSGSASSPFQLLPFVTVLFGVTVGIVVV